ncbi:GDSL-type esterase/lipase family protein [[Eubacterium] cellulosolvens]
MRPAPSLVRVVALGDSLTVGFQSFGLFGNTETSTPYTDFLVGHVRRDFPPSSLSVEIINKGVVGELSEQMLARFDLDVIRLSPRVVIILGGSNDLGWGLTPQEVFSNLREMYELSLKNQIVPIACTVPSILGFDAAIPLRTTLNKLIQEHCRKSEIRCVDLFTATADPATGRLTSNYSADGLHLNTEGYRKMGDTIYEEGLCPVLRVITRRDVSSGSA